jgi:hypothetical protein
MIRSIGRIPAERATDYRLRQTFPRETHEPSAVPPRLLLAEDQSHATYLESGY